MDDQDYSYDVIAPTEDRLIAQRKRYQQLQKRHTALKARVNALQAENAALKADVQTENNLWRDIAEQVIADCRAAGVVPFSLVRLEQMLEGEHV